MSRAIDPRTEAGAVRLTVGDLAGVGGFYERVGGLAVLEAGERRALLCARDRPPVVLASAAP